MRASYAKSDAPERENEDPCGFDFRTRMFAAAVLSTATVYLSDTRLLAALAAATFAYLLASTRRYGVVAAAYAAMALLTALSIATIYGTYGLIGHFAAGTGAEKAVQSMKASLLGNFHTPFLRTLASLNVILALALNLSVQKFTGALKSLRMPRAVFLPLMVFCRFVPEFVDVARQLRDAVRMRGFSVSFGSAFVHPVMAVRLTVVPLAVRTLRTADNLAMACEMKGVGYAKRPTHLRETHFRRRDWIAVAATAALAAAVCAAQASLPQKQSMMSMRTEKTEASK